MVARMQQCLLFGAGALLLAWSAAWWGRTSVGFWAGLAVLLGAHPVVLALEFAIAARVGRSDPTPPPSRYTIWRAWLAEVRCSLLTFCWRQPVRAGAVKDHLPHRPHLPRRGVVLIHGFLCNRGFWNDWMTALRADDRAFVALNLEPVFGSIDSHRMAIAAAVERVTAATGLPPVLVCHSMGGLAARDWLRGSADRKVHRIVTIGTPHRGTWLARFGYSANARQMRQGGDWIVALEHHARGAAEAMPPMTCWYSDCDNIVFPPSCATMPGADNRLASGRGHVQLAFDCRVRAETIALLDR